MMARDPKSRYQSATELISALEKTGCANERLSWIAGASTHSQTRAPNANTVKVSPTEPPRAAADTVPTTDQYVLRYTDKKGKLITTTAEKHQIRDMIRRGLLGTEVECAKDSKGQFRPLMSFPQFADLMKSRLLKEKGDLLGGGSMGDKFAQIDKEEARRRKLRQLKARLARVFSAIILLALLAGAAWFAWNEYNKANTKTAGQKAAVPNPTAPNGTTTP